MTDTPKPLTGAQLDLVEQHVREDGPQEYDQVARLVAEVRATRALLKRIHEKGEPRSTPTSSECVWCGADRDVMYGVWRDSHAADCPWLEIQESQRA